MQAAHSVDPSSILDLLIVPDPSRQHAPIDLRPASFRLACMLRLPAEGLSMATIVASPADRKASERKFYSRMALFLVFLVLLGFGPSFYLRGVVPPYPRPNPTLPPTVILHGTVFTLWMAAIVAQTQLISA